VRDVPDADGIGFGLYGILDDVYEDLPEEVLVCVDDDVAGDPDVPADVGVEDGDGVAKGLEAEVLQYGFLQQGQFAVALHKGGKAGAHVAYGPYSLLVGRAFDARFGQIGLADALYGRGGVHDFVGQHAYEALPGFHLVLRHQLLYLPAHVVESLLQGAFAEEQTLERQMECKVAMAYGIAHKLRPVPEQALVPVDGKGGKGNDEDYGGGGAGYHLSLIHI